MLQKRSGVTHKPGESVRRFGDQSVGQHQFEQDESRVEQLVKMVIKSGG
jgi:hypothetical protein